MSFIEIGEFGIGSGFLYMFIFTMLVVWLSLVLYSFKRYGGKKTVRYFLPMMIAALFLEAGAVSSGRYIYPGYLTHISVLGRSVPLIILLGWSANLFLFLKMSKRVVLVFYKTKNLIRIVLISLLAGLFGVCLDLLEDPIAHHNNWWMWTESVTEASFYGVPFSNFFDWFIILFYMALATQLIERSSYSENRKLLISFFSISFIGVAIFITHSLFVQFI